MSSNTLIVQPGLCYHICNRAVGSDQLFQQPPDYENWMNGIEELILPVADLHAYCLLKNHYHLLVRIKEMENGLEFSKALNRIQSIHAKRYNRRYNRKGSLFFSPFNRIPIMDDAQLAWVFWYIHRNPLHHGINEDWKEYPYSSFRFYQKEKSPLLSTDFMINFFGNKDQILKHHLLNEEAYYLKYPELSLE